MDAMRSQITRVSIVWSTVCSGADHRKHQRIASLAFMRGIHRWPVESPHKVPATRKMFPFHDVIMVSLGTKACAGTPMTKLCHNGSRRYTDRVILSLFLYFRVVTGIYGLILPAAGLAVFVQEKSIQFYHDYKSNTNVAKAIEVMNI